MKKESAIKTLLAIVAASHLIIGVIGYFAPPEIAASLLEMIYKANVNVTPEIQHVIRITGAYMCAIGVMSIFAFLNPEKNRAIIHGIVVLLVLRVSQRFVFADQIQEAFGIPYGHLIGQSVFYLGLAALLFFFCPKKQVQ